MQNTSYPRIITLIENLRDFLIFYKKNLTKHLRESKSHIGIAQLQVIFALRRRKMTVGEISNLTDTNATYNINVLEKEGYIERKDQMSDKRISYINLTKTGLEILEYFEKYLQEIDDKISQKDPEFLDNFSEQLETLEFFLSKQLRK